VSASQAIARLRELRGKAYKGKWSVNGELGIEGERSSATDYDPLVIGGLKGGRGYIEYPHYSLYSQPTKTEGKANAAARLDELERENARMREVLSDAIGVASQHRVAALDAEFGARGDRTRPLSDADWHAFQDRARAALAGSGEK